MPLLTHALRSLYAAGEGGASPLARRWEFREESPLVGSDHSLFIAMGVIALCSLCSTIGLLSFLTYRFINWRQYYKQPLAKNQYVVLIYNLLLIDMQQAIGFTMSLYWATRRSVHFGEAACYLQGWWIQTGDAGSGLFVLAIALHTGAIVLRGRQLDFKTFVCGVIGLWVFILILGFIPVGLYGHESFVISEANWCWLSPRNEDERLWGHYLWIFISEFGTVVLYAAMFFYLRRRMQQAQMLRTSQQESLRRLNRVVFYMVVYPLLYLILSLPLAAGRMSTARGDPPSKTYFGVAGCLMALSGFMDVMVYTLTRRHLIIDTEHTDSDRVYYNGTDSQWQTNITTNASYSRKGFRMGSSRIGSKVRPAGHKEKDRLSPFEGSTENIVPKDDVELSNFYGVYQQTTIEISHEPAPAVEVDNREHSARRDS
ncbi:hypothetical protein N7468_008411 [Penicillium chermesinum]|uniref:G protein-coupled receptor GPR1/2/3 C-terminal domain-containing protein n=1 Tax=Penicillium chermesinum TaxID=63820 RepID=A0A9W9NSJ1_9EURO|nr:uncharacterized protein N7468_008411 [Penicillium chermesinum]KAJ5223869.1 hypothetical protein N7468_008411 [Penicillium chermesinum]